MEPAQELTVTEGLSPDLTTQPAPPATHFCPSPMPRVLLKQVWLLDGAG